MNVISRIKKAWKEDLEKDRLGYLFVAWFAILILYIIYNNWTYMLHYANSDVAGEYLYMKKVAETGNPFTVQYANSSESFFCRPWMIFCIFYIITGNFILSTKLTLLATTVLLALTFGCFFKKLSGSIAEIFLGLLLVFGFFAGKGPGDYMNYLPETVLFRYYNAYSLLAIGMLIVVMFFIDIHNDVRPSKSRKLVILLTTAFYSLSGAKMLCLIYLPIFLVELLYAIDGKLKQQSCDNKGLKWSVVLLAVSVFFNMIYSLLLCPLTHVASFTSGLGIIPQQNISGSVSFAFFSLLRAIGINFNGAPFLSISAWLTICSIGLLCLIGFMARYLKRVGLLRDSENKAIAYFAVSILLLWGYFLITGYPGWYHYWFPAFSLLSILLVFCYRLAKKHRIFFIRYSLVCVVLIGVILNGIYVYGVRPESKTPLMELNDFLEEKGCTRIIGTFWNSHIIGLLSNAEIETLCFIDDAGLTRYDWITDRTNYVNDDGPMTLILKLEEESYWNTQESKAYLLSLAEERESISNYALYHYNQNPFAFNMLEYGYSARFNFLNLLFNNGAKLANGGISLCGGAAQYGPYCAVEAGDYEVVIRGQNLEKADFDVVSEMGQTGYRLTQISVSDSAIQYRLNLSEDVSDLEIRTFNNTNEEIVIYDITLEEQNAKRSW